MLLAQQIFSGLDSFPIMAIPLFILAGELMNESGIADRIIRMASAFVGHVCIGLCQVAILSSVIFAGISGSAVADASALGPVFIAAMEREGHPQDFSGAIPGLLLGGALAVIAFFNARSISPPPAPRQNLVGILAALRAGVIPLLMPVIILATILGGVVTSTEATAVAVPYALVVGMFIPRTITFGALVRAISSSMPLSAVVLFIIVAANLLNWFLTTEQIPKRFTAFVIGQVKDPALFLILVTVLLLIVGCLIEGLAAMIILVPILAPIAVSFGIDPVHFAMVVVLNLIIGLINPPMGLCLFKADGIARVGSPAILHKYGRYWPPSRSFWRR